VVLLRIAKGQSDAHLVAQCRSGDGTAFDELVRRYKDRVYTVAYRFLGNREDALDVAQEVFVRAYDGIGEFRGASGVYTWLYTIASNLSRNWLRDGGRKGRNMAVPLEAAEWREPDAAAPDPRASAQRRELDETLQRCLDELPEACRMAFVLRVFENLSYDEIATAMACPEGTVKSRINQARRVLRERLRELAVI